MKLKSPADQNHRERPPQAGSAVGWGGDWRRLSSALLDSEIPFPIVLWADVALHNPLTLSLLSLQALADNMQ